MIWEWLLLPIDPSRGHVVTEAVAWHGRLMVLAWAVLVPTAILIARFAKVLPSQRWPEELDSQLWWRSHWIMQSLALALCLVAFALVWGGGLFATQAGVHGWVGRAIVLLVVVQVLSGLLRGSKGGPTAPSADGVEHGDHYSMTRRRKVFERFHKTLGYGLVVFSAVGVIGGLWSANAPRWMWLSVMLWWCVLVTVFYILQRRGCAVDTYQAIWGPNPKHPGNRMPPPRWGARRLVKFTDNE